MADWTTIIASGGVGAVAGAVATWVAAPHLANREQRGRARLDAQNAIRAAVEPVLTSVHQYRAHARTEVARDPARHDVHVGDLNFCAALLQHASGLSRWRRYLVTRRLAKLFGPKTVEICGVHGQFAVDPRSSLGVMIVSQYNAAVMPEQFAQPDRGTFDAALRRGPDSVHVAALIASLEQLRDSR